MDLELKISKESQEKLIGLIKYIISESKDEEVIRKLIAEHIENKNDEFINIDEACKMIGCSKTTLYHYRKKGLLKYHQIGRKILFKKSEIIRKS